MEVVSAAPQHDRSSSASARAAIFWLDLTSLSFALGAAVLLALGVGDGPIIFGTGILAALIPALLSLYEHKSGQRRGRWWTAPSATVALVLAVILAGLRLGPDTTHSGIARMTGGCDPFVAYGQNRWEPFGAKLLTAPFREAEQIGSVAPNKQVYLDGWVQTEQAILTNRAPWDSDIWFNMADESGWVSFAGLRALPTVPDPQGGFGDGGKPVAVLEECQGALR